MVPVDEDGELGTVVVAGVLEPGEQNVLVRIQPHRAGNAVHVMKPVEGNSLKFLSHLIDNYISTGLSWKI